MTTVALQNGHHKESLPLVAKPAKLHKRPLLHALIQPLREKIVSVSSSMLLNAWADTSCFTPQMSPMLTKGTIRPYHQNILVQEWNTDYFRKPGLKVVETKKNADVTGRIKSENIIRNNAEILKQKIGGKKEQASSDNYRHPEQSPDKVLYYKNPSNSNLMSINGELNSTSQLDRLFIKGSTARVLSTSKLATRSMRNQSKIYQDMSTKTWSESFVQSNNLCDENALPAAEPVQRWPSPESQSTDLAAGDHTNNQEMLRHRSYLLRKSNDWRNPYDFPKTVDRSQLDQNSLTKTAHLVFPNEVRSVSSDEQSGKMYTATEGAGKRTIKNKSSPGVSYFKIVNNGEMADLTTYKTTQESRMIAKPLGKHQSPSTEPGLVSEYVSASNDQHQLDGSLTSNDQGTIADFLFDSDDRKQIPHQEHASSMVSAKKKTHNKVPPEILTQQKPLQKRVTQFSRNAASRFVKKTQSKSRHQSVCKTANSRKPTVAPSSTIIKPQVHGKRTGENTLSQKSFAKGRGLVHDKNTRSSGKKEQFSWYEGTSSALLQADQETRLATERDQNQSGSQVTIDQEKMISEETMTRIMGWLHDVQKARAPKPKKSHEFY